MIVQFLFLSFIILAAGFNALMDATENENFFESILKGKKQSFWYKRESWKTATKVFGYKIDAWHLFKSFMLLCFFGAVVSYQPLIGWWQDILISGGVWNIVFWIAYHKILGVK
jgi:hypothetical protein